MSCLESYKAGLEDGEKIGMNKLAKAIQDVLQDGINKNMPLMYADIIHCLNEVLDA